MTTTKINSLKKKRDQLNERIKKMEALQKSRERKNDTRRKILIGAYFLDEAKKTQTLEKLYKTMRTYLSRESDKNLFDFKAT